MRDACGDTLRCYNSSLLPVTVPEYEIWQGDAAAGEYPVSCGDGKTDITVFSDTLILQGKIDCHVFTTLIMQIFALAQSQTQFAKSAPRKH